MMFFKEKIKIATRKTNTNHWWKVNIYNMVELQ